MSLKKKSNLLLALILFAALIVRVWGINFGLPYQYHFDEGAIVYTTFFAAGNKLRPDNFEHPMLVPYFLILLYGIYFLLGLILGIWNSIQQFFIAYLNNPTIFLLLGRLFTTFIGVLSVWLVYWVGRKVYQEKIGIIASFFLALTFLYVKESHFIKQDVLVSFLGLLAFYLSFLIVRKGKFSHYLFSGILLGLLFSTKWYSFIFLPMFFIAHLLKSHKDKVGLKLIRERKFLISIFLSLFTFFLLNPYVVLLTERAINDVFRQAQITVGPVVSSLGQPVWFYYLFDHLRFGMGIPLLILAMGGVLFLLFKGRQHKNLLLISTPVSFFVVIGILGGANFDRYAVIILPFLCLTAAIFSLHLVVLFKVPKLKKDFLLAMICIFIIFPSFLRIVKFDYYLSQPDTRTLAKDWIESNIFPGTKIVNEGTMKSEYASVYGPPLWMNLASLSKRLEEVKKEGLPGTYLRVLIEARRGRVGYNLKGTLRLDGEYDTALGRFISLSGVEKYVADDYCYLISSNWAEHNQSDYPPEFKQSLEENYQLIKEFKPNPRLEEDPLAWRVDFPRLDKVNLYAADVISGPEIKIYKLKNNQKCVGGNVDE